MALRAHLAQKGPANIYRITTCRAAKVTVGLSTADLTFFPL